MFQSRNVEASKSSSVLSLFGHIMTDKTMMERKRKYKNCLLQNMKQMAVWNSYYWRRFRTLVSWQNQSGTVRPEKWNLMCYKKHFTKFVQGDFDELEVEGFLRERFTMQATELAIKNKKFIDNSVRCIKRKFWG